MQVIKWILPVIFAAAGVFLSNFIHGHKFLGLCCFCLAGLLICYFLIGILTRHHIVTGKVLRTILSCLLCFGILIFLLSTHSLCFSRHHSSIASTTHHQHR